MTTKNLVKNIIRPTLAYQLNNYQFALTSNSQREAPFIGSHQAVFISFGSLEHVHKFKQNLLFGLAALHGITQIRSQGWLINSL